MKKFLLLILVTGFYAIETKAQVVANYTFSTINTTFTEITGGTAMLGCDTIDDQKFMSPSNLAGDTVTTGTGFSIGFNFTYCGKIYDVFGIDANGWISLGQSSSTPSVNQKPWSAHYSPIGYSFTNPASPLHNRIAPFGVDLQGQAGASLRFETTGSAPNRVLVVQWKGVKRYSSSTNTYDFNFQVRLCETTNVIEFVYGTMTTSSTYGVTAQVGLKGDTTDYINRKSTTSWSASSAGTTAYSTMTLSSTVFPSSGLVYKFTPGIVTPNDAGITLIHSLPSSFQTSNKNILVTIKNFGTYPLTSATIAWKVNSSLQTPYTYNNTGGLPSYTIDDSINIGSYNFANAGTYIIKIWTENPNGVTDGNHINDTITQTVIAYIQGYANLPFFENFDGTWIDKDSIKDVPSSYWKNTPASGTRSWRRNDEGSTAGWTSNSGEYFPTGAQNTVHSARFHSYSTSTGKDGSLYAHLNFSNPGPKMLSLWYINTAGTDSLSIYLSSDGGNTYSFIKKLTNATSWTYENINIGTSTSSTTIIKFRAVSNFGTSDFGLDNVEVFCIPQNDAGITVLNSPTNPVSAGNNNVSVTIKNFGTASLASANIAWKVNNVLQTPYSYNNSNGLQSGTTDGPITIGSYNFASAGIYTIKVWTENPNGSADPHNTNDTATVNLFVQGFSSLPFTENFDGTWISKDSVNDVPSLYWDNNPSTGNKSWRRDDEGTTANWTSSNLGISGITSGAEGSVHFARFHTYYAPINSSGELKACLDFSPYGTKILRFWHINKSGKDTLRIYLSLDGGSSFNILKKLDTNKVWTLDSVDLGTHTSPNTVIQFKATSDYGITDIGIDNITVYIPGMGIGETNTTNAVVNIFPNPTNDLTYFDIRGINNANIEIYTVQGQIVYLENITGTNYNKQINLSYLPKGVYMVKISDEKNKILKKLIIQ